MGVRVVILPCVDPVIWQPWTVIVEVVSVVKQILLGSETKTHCCRVPVELLVTETTFCPVIVLEYTALPPTMIKELELLIPIKLTIVPGGAV